MRNDGPEQVSELEQEGIPEMDDVDALSPEESAVHVISEEEAPGVTWDEGPGYLDDDEE